MSDNDMCQAKQSEAERIQAALGHVPDDLAPLGEAVLCNDLEEVQRLLAQGADPNKPSGRGGFTPVVVASALPRHEILKTLLANGGDPDSFDEDSGETALVFAYSQWEERDHGRTYEILLDAGADVNFAPRGTKTVAHRMLARGDYRAFSDLLDLRYRKDLPRLLRMTENDNVRDDRIQDHAALVAKLKAIIAEEGLQK
ncbi:ankyrin repeat domain-containing protein [Qipengyuania qiaonensis]|uniref:Ankyrin repeat domain-containing protein n=1 Tax=Qipengyuania qiaonensis TaxID=2867240 RepID=A0ABS7JF89_9SPHN|nr:ankyrin repeat domain-containing protein [Qipengyuania qiaonensis]MBX7483702.1 ankyrin repeat domain-containing protein [Qipengyuania qiaonensis]